MKREIKFEYMFADISEDERTVIRQVWEIKEIEQNELIYNQLFFIARRQYTGWKDKNLKEIYDGDIMKSSIDNIEDIFAIDLNRLDWFISPKGHAFDNGSISFEVIGDIYENPELLK